MAWGSRPLGGKLCGLLYNVSVKESKQEEEGREYKEEEDEDEDKEGGGAEKGK